MSHAGLFQSIALDGFLSFGPRSPAFEMTPLNVLIGPNASGKSNLIEAFEVLRAVPTDLSAVIRDGGGIGAWLYKGPSGVRTAHIETVVERAPNQPRLRYRLGVAEVSQRLEVVDELLTDCQPRAASLGQPDPDHPTSHYHFIDGRPFIHFQSPDGSGGYREIKRESLAPGQSILSQRRDPDTYPELTWMATHLEDIATFREWRFGPHSDVRRPQGTDAPTDRLLPDMSNLALVLGEIEHAQEEVLARAIRRFLPQYQKLRTRVHGGSVQLYLYEQWLGRPVPASRLSDGTLRFLAILAALLAPVPPSLLCIEEPELGLHPDAVALLAELFVEASDRMQLVITTHSDVLISALSDQVESVVVCENAGNGTELRRLDRRDLSSWLDSYMLGDAWRAGALGGNP